MKTIHFEELERGQFVRTLQYAKEKKLEDYKNKQITEKMYLYDIEIINRLIDRLDGNYVNMNVYEISKAEREKEMPRKWSEEV